MVSSGLFDISKIACRPPLLPSWSAGWVESRTMESRKCRRRTAVRRAGGMGDGDGDWGYTRTLDSRD